MPVFISEEEQQAIGDYYNHPERYVDEAVLRTLLVDGLWPNGTKVSRAKLNPANKNRIIPRHYIVPDPVSGEIRRVPISGVFEQDIGAHSATRLNEVIYFHQNKDDLPKKLPDNFELYHRVDDDEDPESEVNQALRAAWMQWIHELGKPEYVLNINKPTVSKKTVKHAVDRSGNTFFLKSQSMLSLNAKSALKLIAAYLPQTIPSVNPVEVYAPAVYPGSCLFRQHTTLQYRQIKRVDITRDCGQDLCNFISSHGHELSEIECDILALEIIQQYLEQISDKKIVHTDIKPSNICVQKTNVAERPFEVMFIDFDGAFSASEPKITRRSTQGYLASEFFNTLDDFKRQSERSHAEYIKTLKPNHTALFSEASDVFALGTVLLDYFAGDNESLLHEVVIEMRAIQPEDRSSAERLREVLQLLEYPFSIESDEATKLSY